MAILKAVKAVIRILAAKGISLQRGAYGCIAWNAQLAHCIHHIFTNDARNALADALEEDAEQTVRRLTEAVLDVYLDDIDQSKNILAKFNGKHARIVWFFSNGFDRFCEILSATACAAYPYRVMHRRVLSNMHQGLTKCLMDLTMNLTGESTGESTGNRIASSVVESVQAFEPDDHKRVISPEEMIVLQDADDAIVRELVRNSTTTLTMLEFMEMHLSGSELRDACKIDSILPEESTSTYDLLDASCRFVRLALGDNRSWRTELVLAALFGEQPSWVLRGACSSDAESLTGWFALRGQRPASVAYWRIVGWKLSDEDAAKMHIEIMQQLNQNPEMLLRFANMCLFCPTRFSIHMLTLEFDGSTTLLQYAIRRWIASKSTESTESTKTTNVYDPLLCMTRRLGGTVSLAYTTSKPSAGLKRALWDRIHAREDAIRFPDKHHESHAHEEIIDDKDDKDDKLRRDPVQLLYDELYRSLNAHAADIHGGSTCHWMIMANALTSYDRHDPEYLSVCLRTSIEIHMRQLTVPPYIEGLATFCNSPAYFYYPIDHESNPSSTRFNSESSKQIASRLLHRAGQNVSHLIDQAIALRVTHSEKGDRESPLSSSRHAALVLLMPSMQTSDKGNAPVIFARFITPTTSMSFPPNITSDVLREDVDRARANPKSKLTLLPSTSILNEVEESFLINLRMNGGSTLAAKCVLCMQQAAFDRHARVRQEAIELHKARISLVTERGRGQVMRMLSAQYKTAPENIESMLVKAHESLQDKSNSGSTEPTKSSTDQTHEGFDKALQELIGNGFFDTHLSQKGTWELNHATPYPLNLWDQRIDFAKQMTEQRRCLAGTPYDAASQHVMSIVAAARDEWITRGTHTIEGNVDPECGLIPMLITWETRATDLDRVGGDEATKQVCNRERKHVSDMSKLVVNSKMQPSRDTEGAKQLVKNTLRASMKLETIPGMTYSLQ